MNIDYLHTIFANYIRKFDIINQPWPGHNENYKWRLAEQFPDLIDPDAPNFTKRLKRLADKRISYNLFNSASHYPLTALIKCAEKDENAVRNLFRALYEDDGDSLIFRQRKIDDFLTNANALITQAYPGRKNIRQYKNNQRSAMSFLFFRDPERHYLYKPVETNRFADIVEFTQDWGKSTDFKMDVYYRMCDELVEEIKKCDLLLRTTRRRYYDAAGSKVSGVHPDKNYHILAFDIIWGTAIVRNPDYNFGNGIPWMGLDEAMIRADNAKAPHS